MLSSEYCQFEEIGGRGVERKPQYCHHLWIMLSLCFCMPGFPSGSRDVVGQRMRKQTQASWWGELLVCKLNLFSLLWLNIELAGPLWIDGVSWWWDQTHNRWFAGLCRTLKYLLLSFLAGVVVLIFLQLLCITHRFCWGYHSGNIVNSNSESNEHFLGF